MTSDVAVGLIGSVTAILIAFLVTYFNQRMLIMDRQAERKAKLISAAQSLLVEVQSIINFANEPWTSRMLQLPDDIWRTSRAEVYGLSEDAQTMLTKLYIELEKANSIVRTDMYKLPWGSGYLDRAYQEECLVIVNIGKELEPILKDWINGINKTNK
jgi:hypothetical protein